MVAPGAYLFIVMPASILEKNDIGALKLGLITSHSCFVRSTCLETVLTSAEWK